MARCREVSIPMVTLKLLRCYSGWLTEVPGVPTCFARALHGPDL